MPSPAPRQFYNINNKIFNEIAAKKFADSMYVRVATSKRSWPSQEEQKNIQKLTERIKSGDRSSLTEINEFHQKVKKDWLNDYSPSWDRRRELSASIVDLKQRKHFTQTISFSFQIIGILIILLSEITVRKGQDVKKP